MSGPEMTGNDSIRRPGTRFSKAEMESMRRASRDEAGVFTEFWARVKSVGRNLPFAEDMVSAAFCALDSKTPTRVRALVVGAIAYFVMPIDGIPDFLPLIGFTDDAAVIAATVAAIQAHMTPEHREKAREFLKPNDT